MFIQDYQNSRYLNYGFIHNRYDLTQYGQLVWKVFDLETNQYLLLIVNSDHYVIETMKIDCKNKTSISTDQ